MDFTKDRNSLELIPTQASNTELSFEARKYTEHEVVVLWLLQKKEKTTRRNYRREIESFFGRFPGITIESIDLRHIVTYLEERSTLSPASKKFSKDVISSLLSFSVKVGHISRNQALALDPIKVPDRTAFRTLSVEQVFRLIDRADGLRNQLIIKLLYYSGVRVSELCSLRWSNFQVRRNGVQMTVVGKGNKVRSVILSLDLWNEMQVLKSENLGVESEKAAVFLSQKGGAIQPTQILRIVKAAAKSAKIVDGVSPHWLRHCHATHSAERGAPIHIIKKTLGHASIVTTEKYISSGHGESSSSYLAK